ncbi:MAG: CarD family transcriptional regulator, partial [Blastocatellia bacterium]
MREMTLRREDFMNWAGAAKGNWSDERFRRDLQLRLAHAERGETFPGWEYLLPLTRPAGVPVLNYFQDALVLLDEPVEIEREAARLYTHLAERYSQADEAGELALEPHKTFLTPEELTAQLRRNVRVEMRLLGRIAAATDEQFRIESLLLPESSPDTLITGGQDSSSLLAQQAAAAFLLPVSESSPEIALVSVSSKRYQGRIPELAEDLTASSAAGKRTLIVASSHGIGERLTEMLGEYGIAAAFSPSASATVEAPAGGVSVVVGRLSNGFELPPAGLSVLVESDIFGKVERPVQRVARGRRQRSIEAFLSDLGDLKVGDYVVHVDHGIGQFQGLKQIPVAATGGFNIAEGIGPAQSTREFMLLTYDEGAKLYVPVERLDLIQRFSAGEGNKPQLDRLGGAGWQKTKARVKRAMKDMAEELLKLYAERKLVSGHAFGADTPWQKEFEEAFEFPLTPDQATSVDDVKTDMEKAEPMDRLIVGDVGYGKTEVALRAAFKAVMEGKQVAVLAPTTVLSNQHYQTFKSRCAAFPVKIDMLSRFRSPREQKET